MKDAKTVKQQEESQGLLQFCYNYGPDSKTVQEKNGEDLVGILEHATGLRSDISVRR
jgi:hypothetical protein